ncbi:MAG: CDP-glycerol glycerophosphotransferase family protein [Bacilli bacterium]
MKYLLIKVAIFLLNIIYFFLKLFPVKNKIVMISRQSNSETIDFKLIRKEIEKHHKYKVIVLCKKLEGKENAKISSLISYAFNMLRQMYNLATSKVCIIDSYCICVSVLKHKKKLKIIQIWHSIGTMKKFGYEILDQEEGSSSKMAKVMKMHNNYDVVLCGGEGYIDDLCRGFNCKKDIIKVIPLPRVDEIIDRNKIIKLKKKIYSKYPKLKNKKNILYCPTFRKNEYNMKKYVQELIDKVDYSKYNLIIKLHPLSKINITDKRVILAPIFSSTDMISVSDYVITDYSCILYEAGLSHKPLYFYCFDYDEYNKNRSLNIDYYNELPGVVSKDINKILYSINNEKYDYIKLNKFIKKYININGNSSERIYRLIENLVNEDE